MPSKKTDKFFVGQASSRRNSLGGQVIRVNPGYRGEKKPSLRDLIAFLSRKRIELTRVNMPTNFVAHIAVMKKEKPCITVLHETTGVHYSEFEIHGIPKSFDKEIRKQLKARKIFTNDVFMSRVENYITMSPDPELKIDKAVLHRQISRIVRKVVGGKFAVHMHTWYEPDGFDAPAY